MHQQYRQEYQWAPDVLVWLWEQFHQEDQGPYLVQLAQHGSADHPPRSFTDQPMGTLMDLDRHLMAIPVYTNRESENLKMMKSRLNRRRSAKSLLSLFT